MHKKMLDAIVIGAGAAGVGAAAVLRAAGIESVSCSRRATG